eukprot:3484646-Prymnesium_polylepis.1
MVTRYGKGKKQVVVNLFARTTTVSGTRRRRGSVVIAVVRWLRPVLCPLADSPTTIAGGTGELRSVGGERSHLPVSGTALGA